MCVGFGLSMDRSVVRTPISNPAMTSFVVQMSFSLLEILTHAFLRINYERIHIGCVKYHPFAS